MSMFDTYIPEPPLSCPVCGSLIEQWQGYDAACLLFTWKQGQRYPVRHGWPEECVEDEQQFLQSHALPESFAFYSWDCKCDRQPLAAYGYCEDGVWVRSEFVTHLNWRPGPQHNVRDEHKIKRDLERWLKSKGT